MTAVRPPGAHVRSAVPAVGPESAPATFASVSPGVVLSPEQWPLLESLFQRVFGHPLERALTLWKYGPGRGIAVALVEPGDAAPGCAGSAERAVAHCGLIWRDIQRFGSPARAAQLTDLMVDPEARGTLTRQGSAFSRVIAATYRELESIAAREGARPFAFGFPSDRAMQLGERLGVFCEVDRIVQASWSAAARDGMPDRLSIASAPASAGAIDSLWRAMSLELSASIVGERGAGSFLARYLQHPTRHYEVYLVRSRWLRRPLAVFVLRRHADGEVELCDWVSARAHTAAMVAAARSAAAACGGQRLFAWITRSHQGWLDGTAAAFEPLEFRIMCRADIAREEIERARGRWWLTSGDTDYR